MIGKIVQQLIRWLPLLLLVLLFMVDRENSLHVFGYIILLFAYTSVLIMRILYAKEKWHQEFDSGNLGQNTTIQKMSDLTEKLEEQNEFNSKS